MSEEIKPCEVCKSLAGIYIMETMVVGRKLFSVHCRANDSNYLGTEGVSDDWCPTEEESHVWYESEAEAITAWNTRPSPKLAEAYKNRLEAVESLGVCYRLQKRPTEKLLNQLDKTKKRLDKCLQP